ncbi:MAG: hypothetical protein QOD42_3279 [Sphingomonadales bacterium]|jgi:predicted dienelactone hydrolase|nr:hypothetical protein [Sphingomonadales bacterium]
MVGRPEWLADRSRHVAAVIDFMLIQWEGRARLIPDRVGIFGFSAGATTALIAIGGVPDLAAVPAHCARVREFVCTLMARPGTRGGFGPPSLRARPPHRRGRRRRAGPGLCVRAVRLANVRVPVQLWAGAADETVPYETNAGVVRQLPRGPVDFRRVAGAVHLSFLAPCGPESPPQICQDGEGFDRPAFHRELNRSMIDFFRRHLVESARDLHRGRDRVDPS